MPDTGFEIIVTRIKRQKCGNPEQDRADKHGARHNMIARVTNDKKADLIATDPVKIARSLFGKSATVRTLDSIENMMAALPADQAQRLLDQARQDPSWL